MSDLPVDNLLSVEQAIAILDAVPIRPRVVNVPLDAALGHRLAEDVFADRDYPPFDKAVMDGFAVRAADTAVAGATLRVIDVIHAGEGGQLAVGPGEAAGIMTGAPLPAGADAVVPVEQTTPDRDHVTIRTQVKPSQAIARRGSDALMGRLLLASGTTLHAAQIGVAATVGKAQIAVYGAPSVALLATGDELVEIDRQPKGSQIRNSNIHMMRALLTKLGCRVRDLGISRDNPNEIRTAIRAGLEDDALFITGGMSMGERDYVPAILRELGLDLRIKKLRIKPGKPFVFAVGMAPPGRLNPPMVFGLPGNPVSAFVCTIRLASRVLTRLSGGTPTSQVQFAKLLSDLPANGPRETYLPGHCEGDTVKPLPFNGSADLFTLALANSLLIRLENAPAVSAGEKVPTVNLF